MFEKPFAIFLPIGQCRSIFVGVFGGHHTQLCGELERHSHPLSWRKDVALLISAFLVSVLSHFKAVKLPPASWGPTLNHKQHSYYAYPFPLYIRSRTASSGQLRYETIICEEFYQSGY